MNAGSAVRELLRVPRPPRPWSRMRWIVGSALTLGIAPLAKTVGRLWTWTAVVTLIGLGLGALPLFGVLGYELAIAMTFVGALMGLDVGAALAREQQRGTHDIAGARYAGRTLLRGTLVAIAAPVAIMLIPAIISAVRGLWLPTCDWGFGLRAYVLLPLTTTVLAGATGHAIGVLVARRRFVGSFAPFLPVILVAIAALWRFYAAPAVFTYNAILGYFPGNLYDENVELGAALYWSRLEQLAWVVALVALVARFLDVPTYRASREARPVTRPIGALVVGALAISGALALRLHSGHLGYAVDAEDIEVELGGRIETPHFVIYYAHTKEIDEVIGLVAADHEFRLAQVVAQLGVSPTGKLRSFYFADRDQKARWMGARDVEMAKPWRREIYLDHRSFPHGSLRHEIAHAVASEFGDPFFGVATKRVLGVPVFVSPGLIEGLAVATDWPGGYDRFTPHESVRVLQEMGKRPEIQKLLSLQFFSVSSATGYTTAGSFLRFLLDTYGAAPLRAVYHSGGEFQEAYGKSLAVLEGEWRAMISTIVLPAGAVEASRERFRVGGVFSRPCPHAIAASRELAQERAGKGDRKGALALLRDVCHDAPEEPRYRLELADLLGGGDDEERGEAMGLWTNLANDTKRVTSTLRAEAYERLAKVAALRGDLTKLQALLDAGTSLALSDVERRQLDAMKFSLAYPGPAGPALRGYFFGAGPGMPSPASWAALAVASEPTLGFGYYLVGLQALGRGEYAMASEHLERGLALGVPGPGFVKNGARRLLITAYRTKDTARVKAAIAALSADGMSTSDRLLAKDYSERLAFDAKPATSPR